MKKIIFIFGLNIFFMTQAIAFQNSLLVNPVEYFQTIAARTQSYKYQIQRCYEMTKVFTHCNGGMNGIDPDIKLSDGNIASLTTSFGIITILPVPEDIILPMDSYILTPSISYHTFSWTASGRSVEKGYVSF
jgi:hypothetical protein